MYDNSTSYKIKINWKAVIIRTICFLLVLMIAVKIISLFTQNEDKERIFGTNMTTMKDAAKGYFNSETLPSKIGDTASITLKEMIDKNLLIEFKDKNNKTCDEENSYAQVTKTNDTEFALKVQLTCSSESNFVLDTITVAKTCENCSTDANTETDTENKQEEVVEKEYITEYQYKKQVTKNVTEYTCPEGYELKGKTCYKYQTPETIPPTKIYFKDSIVYYEAKASTGDKIIQNADPIKSVKSEEKVCPEGYTLDNNTCYKYEAATVIPGTAVYSCPTGYTLKNKTCVKETEKLANTQTVTNYSCNAGSTLSGSTCTYNATYHNGSTSCSCPNGGSLSGSTCSYTAQSSTYWSNPSETVSSTQLSTYNNGSQKRVLVNSSCSSAGIGKPKSCTYTYWTYNIITSYSCNNGGSRSGSTCTYDASCNTTNGYYTCNAGDTLSESTCSYNATKNSTENVTYSCPTGYTDSNGSCIQTTEPTITTTEASYTCPTGYTKNGTTCYTTTEPTIKTEYEYNCPEEYTKNVSEDNVVTCTKEIIPETEYYCDNAEDVLEGTQCKRVIKGSFAGYTCPTGYRLINDECVKDEIICEDATETTKQEISYEYSWSTETVKAGWTQTGKTRQKEITQK